MLTSLLPPNDKGTRTQCAPFSSRPSNRHPSACGQLERRGEKKWNLILEAVEQWQL